jgi:benzoyl-CoA reductase subunit B
MGKPFERTMEMINGVLKPGLELFSASDDADWKLQALRLDGLIKRMENLCQAAEDPDKTVALVENGVYPQLFYAFDCQPFILEGFPGLFTANRKQVLHEFLDAAESSGLPSEVCSTDRFLVGAAACGELPNKNSFLVTCSQPCDGTRIAYPAMKKALGIPTLFLEVPTTYEREAARWYGRQIRTELIPFLEEVTKKKFDIDRFRQIIEESNKAYELMLEVHDTYVSTPMPVPAGLRAFPSQTFSSSAGHPDCTSSIEAFHREVIRRLKEGIPHPVEEKFRIVWGHIPPAFYPQMFAWMEKKLGASVITTSLTGSAILFPIDTTSVETMFEGYAWQGLDMTMSLMRFDTREMIEYTMKLYHQYRCNAVICTQHVGCNNICGAGGMMRRYFQKEGIPALFLEFDYNDDRVASVEQLKDQLEEFFTTITV